MSADKQSPEPIYLASILERAKVLSLHVATWEILAMLDWIADARELLVEASVISSETPGSIRVVNDKADALLRRLKP